MTTNTVPCAGCGTDLAPGEAEVTVTRQTAHSAAGLPTGTWHYCITCAVIAHLATRAEPEPRQPYPVYAAQIYAADAHRANR